MNESAPEPDGLPSGITRDVLERDGLRRAMQVQHPDVALIPEREVHASIEAMLASRPADAVDIWVFAYGSLLWNPCVEVVERRKARLHGFHRDFRLHLTYGRGSPEAPGLMLGLVPGGSCRGMALRLPEQGLRHEMLMVWRREMLTGVYEPRWVGLRSGMGRLPAIAFVTNPHHPCYCRRLEEDAEVRLLATGHGMLGTSRAYLDNTVVHLEEQGIHDRRLRQLRERVDAWRKSA